MSKERTLNEVCEFIVDCLHATAPTKEQGYPLIRTPNIGKGRLLLDGVYRISENTYQEWTRRAVPQANDLILAREAPAGNIALIKEGQQVCLGQRTVHLRPDFRQVDPQFLCYYLLAPLQQGALLAGETGATSKHVNMKDIRKLPLRGLPRRDAQNFIGQVLGTYDDLIENNRRRIALLEESARLLYKEWFVHLRFPGHEQVKVVDGVPEGWERKALSALACVNKTSLKKGFQGEIEYIDIAAVSPGAINNTTILDFEEAPSRARRVVAHGDIIWSCVRPNRKSHAVVWNPSENLIASTGFAVISPKALSLSSFLYYSTTTQDYVDFLSNVATGVAYPAVKADDFKRSIILVPIGSLLDDFSEVTLPIFEQVYLLSNSNRKLAEARDLLLPRLMNGEIKV